MAKKNINIVLDSELWNQLRIKALKNNMPANKYLTEVIKKNLESK
jgi:predicted DNA binding CopG/RHH family protein